MQSARRVTRVIRPAGSAPCRQDAISGHVTDLGERYGNAWGPFAVLPLGGWVPNFRGLVIKHRFLPRPTSSSDWWSGEGLRTADRLMMPSTLQDRWPRDLLYVPLSRPPEMAGPCGGSGR